MKRFLNLLGRLFRRRQHTEKSSADFLNRWPLSKNEGLCEYNGIWNRDRLFKEDVRILFFISRRDPKADGSPYAFTAYEQCECVVEITKEPPKAKQLNSVLIISTLDNIANPDIDPNLLENGVNVKLMSLPYSDGPSLVSMAYVKRVLDTDYDQWISLYKTGSYKLYSKEKI